MDKLLKLADEYFKRATRKRGKSLRELGEIDFVYIYRAVAENVNSIGSMDYVTLSLKFAKEHAEHQAVVNEEPYIVLRSLVKTSDVYEAYNVGEYFYDGPTVKATIIYRTGDEML